MVVIPVYTGMDSLNHWIPAFAGRLRASSAACSRRRSTTYIPVGVPSRRIQDFLSINDDGACAHITVTFNIISVSPVIPVCLPRAGRNNDATVWLRLHHSCPFLTYSPHRHSSESWNPVVYIIHSRLSGNGIKGLLSNISTPYPKLILASRLVLESALDKASSRLMRSSRYI